MSAVDVIDIDENTKRRRTPKELSIANEGEGTKKHHVTGHKHQSGAEGPKVLSARCGRGRAPIKRLLIIQSYSLRDGSLLYFEIPFLPFHRNKV
jgi:hypothetical protein